MGKMHTEEIDDVRNDDEEERSYRTAEFQRHVNTSTLMKKLREVEVGGFISYREMSKAIHCDVQREGRTYLRTARACLDREEQVVFDVRINEGLERLDESGKVHSASSQLRRVRRAAERARRRTLSVNTDDLSGEDRLKLTTAQRVSEVIVYSTSRKSMKRLEDGAKVSEDFDYVAAMKLLHGDWE